MTYMRSWKSLRLTSHIWLGLNPQIGRPLSRSFVPLVYFINVWDSKASRMVRLSVHFRIASIRVLPVRCSMLQYVDDLAVYASHVDVENV
jgi:hypothetical protein